MTDRTRSDAHTHAEGGEASSQIHLRSGPAGSPELESEPGHGLLGSVAAKARRAAAGKMPNPDLLEAVRARPLTSVALLFSAGFLLAVSTGGGRRPPVLDRARSRVRTVLLTGLTAAIAQELRSIVSEEDLTDLFAAWTGHDEEEYTSVYEDDFDEDEL